MSNHEERGKIMKVTIEYEHEVHSIEGEDAEKYEKHLGGLAVLNYTHNYFIEVPKLNWKVAVKEKP